MSPTKTRDNTSLPCKADMNSWHTRPAKVIVSLVAATKYIPTMCCGDQSPSAFNNYNLFARIAKFAIMCMFRVLARKSLAMSNLGHF